MYNWLRNQNLRRPKNDNAAIQLADNLFMKDSYAQSSVEYILLDRAKRFSILEEFADHCRRRGYMKTETDRKIVDSVIRKSKHLKSDPDYFQRKAIVKQKEKSLS